MTEIGIGHNRGPELWHNDKKRVRQLEPARTSILEYSPEEIKKHRHLEVAALCTRGQSHRRVVSGPLAVRVNDHHERVDVGGKCRCLIGVADDLTTAAGDDDLSDHLYVADDPHLRAFGIADWVADGATTDEDEPDEEPPEETPEDTLAPGVVYSTASERHQKNTKGDSD